METIVLASGNRDKITELRSTLAPLEITLLSSYDFPNLEEVVEDKPNLKGNALKKARYVCNQTGYPALSDDTGLEVDALDGRPGVHSARYAGESASYQDNIDKLLDELSEVQWENRKAQFRTVIALVSDKGEYAFEGVCRGEILTEQRGDGGFGYDPVFRPDNYEQTFGELDPEIKNRISHRGKAIAELVTWLENKI